MSLARALKAAAPRARVSEQATDREALSHDLWPRRLLELRAGRPSTLPAAVVWPSSTEDVAAIVAFARERGVPLVPFGAGSGVCGGISPSTESIVVDLKALSDLVVSPEEPVITAGAGLLGIALEEKLAERGVTVGNYPSSILCSTVGGWAATRAAGQCSGKYGKVEDMVSALEFVSGRGDVVTLRRRQGLDLTRLVIGSEGTLGVVTRVSLRTHAAPTARAFAAFSFPDMPSAWETLRTLYQSGLRPSVARLYDPLDSLLASRGSVDPAEAADPDPALFRKLFGQRFARRKQQALWALFATVLGAPRALATVLELAERTWLAQALLILVFEGHAEVEADKALAETACRRAGARPLGDGPARAWFEKRYAVSYWQAPVFRSGAFLDTLEVAAPWSRIGALYASVKSALLRHALVLCHLSHAYPDGCSIYFTFLGSDRDERSALRKYDAAWRDALQAASKAGGTLSHHHGVGRSKAFHLQEELGAGVEVLRRLARAWDPSGIMNPGNLVPPPESSAPGRSPPPEAHRKHLDDLSLLVSSPASETLGELEARVQRSGLTLGLRDGWSPEHTLAAWIDRGMPWLRSPWEDPVEQRIAGFGARLESGLRFELPPAPRRAAGPDLTALFVGAEGAVGHPTHAVLRAHRVSARPSRSLGRGPDDPPVSSPERDLFRQIQAVLRE